MQPIKHVHIFVQQDLGIQDILISEGHIAYIAPHIEAASYVEITDGSGRQLTPGLTDRYVHVNGGGGEGGFATRAPEIQLSVPIRTGITTAVGLLGTDGVTCSVEDSIAKVKTPKSEGISAYAITGSYVYPSTAITGSVKKDTLFIDETLDVKPALSDHRSSHISSEEFLRLASEVRTAGMLSGKSGCMTLHMGDEADDLAYVMKAVKNTGFPCTMFHPTHTTRNEQPFQKALQLLYMGGTIGITCEEHGGCASWIKQANPKDYGRTTVSSDGQGSWSDYDEYGNLTATGVSDVSAFLQNVQRVMRNQDSLITECTSFSIANPTRVLGLYPAEDCISVGNNADLSLFDNDRQLHDITANGRWFMKNQKFLKRGILE